MDVDTTFWLPPRVKVQSRSHLGQVNKRTLSIIFFCWGLLYLLKGTIVPRQKSNKTTKQQNKKFETCWEDKPPGRWKEGWVVVVLCLRLYRRAITLTTVGSNIISLTFPFPLTYQVKVAPTPPSVYYLSHLSLLLVSDHSVYLRRSIFSDESSRKQYNNTHIIPESQCLTRVR